MMTSSYGAPSRERSRLLDETESGQKAEKRGVLDHMIKSGGAVCGGKELTVS